VAARGPQEARSQHPGADNCGFWGSASWVSGPGLVQAKYLGRARRGTKAGVVCASYNAG